MIKLFSKNRLGALIIIIILFNSAYSECLDHSITLSSEFISKENIIHKNHQFSKTIQSLVNWNANTFSLISLISQKRDVFRSHYFHLNSLSTSINIMGKGGANSSSQFTPANFIIWLLFVNYLIVFFSSFIIIYRTRTNRTKQKVFHRFSFRNREKVV